MIWLRNKNLILSPFGGGGGAIYQEKMDQEFGPSGEPHTKSYTITYIQQVGHKDGVATLLRF